MVLQPECDSAVDDIVNETICGNFDDVPVEVELSNLKQSDKIKKLIREEFQKFFVFLILIIVLMKSSVVGMSMVDYFIIRLSIQIILAVDLQNYVTSILVRFVR